MRTNAANEPTTRGSSQPQRSHRTDPPPIALEWLDEIVLVPAQPDPLMRSGATSATGSIMHPLGSVCQPDLELTIGPTGPSTTTTTAAIKSVFPIVIGTAPWPYLDAASRTTAIRLAGRTGVPVELWAPLTQAEVKLIETERATVIGVWDTGRFGVSAEYLAQCHVLECCLLDQWSPAPVFYPPAVCKQLRLKPSHPIELPAAMMDCQTGDDLPVLLELCTQLHAEPVPIILTIPASGLGAVLTALEAVPAAGRPSVVVVDCEGGWTGANQPWPAALALAELRRLRERAKVRAASEGGAGAEGATWVAESLRVLISAPVRSGMEVVKLVAMGAAGVLLRGALWPSLAGQEAAPPPSGPQSVPSPSFETATRFVNRLKSEVVGIMATGGWATTEQLDRSQLRATSYDAAAILGLPLAGYDRELPMWMH